MKVNNLTVELGYDCNGACDYCFQKSDRQNKTGVFQDIDGLLVLLRFLDKNDLLDDNFTIMLYGGESLLYKEMIQKIIDRIRENFHPIFKITTNGLLLNEKNVEWILKNNIHPTISVDGGPKVHNLHRKNIIDNQTFYRQIREFNTMKGSVISTAQSTITPDTVSELFSSFLTIENLGFDKWWFELECLSKIGRSHWTDKIFKIYQEQLEQIVDFSDNKMEILPFSDMDKFLNKQYEESGSLYINAQGEIHCSCRLINNLTPQSLEYFYFGNLSNIDEDIAQKLNYVIKFCNQSPYFYNESCNSCIMNGFCLREIPGDKKAIYLQDRANCGFWLFMGRARYE